MPTKTIKWICAACEQEIPLQNADLDVGTVECATCEVKYDVTPIQSQKEIDPQQFNTLLHKHGVPNRENQLRFRQRNPLFYYVILLWLALIGLLFGGGGLVLIWKFAFGKGGLDSLGNFFKALIAGAGGFLFLWLGIWAIVGFLAALFRSLGRTHFSQEKGLLTYTVSVGPFPFRRREIPIHAGSNLGISLQHFKDEADWEEPVTECLLFLETNGEKIDGRELWLPEEDLPFLVAWLEKQRDSAL